ncbi:HAD-IIIA family hydrolase [Actinomadura rayongensis]|uniref:D,D-heptose 1,7-bisphosphate phosphatase n=1 Tax=Actinomadura rayongensis TaxID=1429076 RepID=A0A6I4WAV4_9ACTN|nr:HAD-IIIA family hydrolase [Actinomadura rayongensis]MXQ64204.1 HAD-IIIA family hydrolase [Actinomadura rayongensis]
MPTLARPCLRAALESLAAALGPAPEKIVLVDDRPGGPHAAPKVPEALADRTEIVASGGVGPAGARNLGWRRTRTPWVVFLDDDVRVGPGWRDELAADLESAARDVGGVQGDVSVPLPRDRPPTDWERGTAGLASARWITADMAYRRAALIETGGFDERFPRAFREDADLALRVLADGWRLETGIRRTEHPVRPAGPWASLRAQRGNADDALMRRLHGADWYERAGETPGRRSRHLGIVAAGASALTLALTGHRRAAALLGALTAAGVGEFAAARIAPGPRTAREIAAMLATSAAIPPAAVWHWARGTLAARAARPWPPEPRVLLFDRDDTLIRDVPYNGDPALVEPMPGAREALDAARARGLRIGVVSNQSGIARGLLTAAQAHAVNRRTEELLGPFDAWEICPHGPGDGCSCRKPAPGLVLRAAGRLGAAPHECAVIGDIGGDVAAAHAAGARAVLVPTARTLPGELTGARRAADLGAAVALLLDGARAGLWQDA